MLMGYAILGIAFLFYLYVSVRAITAVYHTLVFSRRQKRVHYVFILLLPFLWAFFVRASLRELPGTHKKVKELRPSDTTPPEEINW